ncbi:phosphatase yfbT [Verticillium alfalfae VaMs.102]|uniref:Phosphatase yfbT n=1 Tax=Verticillium alfalfae (strain VaMs.102 / ATCC MYA-4576 / FGSC 10136) TaxID=526221 RepID=C9SJG0_VERA1|nr:phosphatase yfbT [Verticillium alfalfae VaMs.102]EEY18322.1 phosphatase yfbT [Verticillium alfalfae VaMs.102]
MGSTATGVNASFTAAPERATFDGFLFDMDGTIIDSTPAIEKHWHSIGQDIGVSANVILQTSHGRRSIDLTLAGEEEEKEETPSLPLPCHDPDVREAEGRLPKLYAHEAIEVPGARTLLEELNRDSAPWTIVTSGTEPLVTGWLGVMALPHPDQMVTAESVENGKPDPACYLLGRQRLGLEGDAKRVLVLEDAPAGIRAGKAAGCKVIGLVTSHTVDQVAAAEPDWIVRDLSSVKVVESKDGVVTLEISNGLVQ